MTQKNILYIVGGVVIVGIIGFIGMNYIPGLNGVKYQQNLNGTATYSDKNGTATIGTGASMPSSWPADAPANYAGAKITFSGNSNPQTGKPGAMVSYTVNEANQAVVEYYKNKLAEMGWTIEGNVNSGNQTIIGAKKDTRTFAISIMDDGTGTITVIAGLGL